MATQLQSQTVRSGYNDATYRRNPPPVPARTASPNIAPSKSVESSKSQDFKSRYKFIKEIGHGSQGKVFLAIRLSDNKQVVIKQLNIQSIKSWKEYELFEREAKVLKSLNCPGVAKFYEAVECLTDDPPASYIVQEYIPGASLQKMLSDGHRFSMDDVYDIIIQTLYILDNLHRHNPPIIHRDIKPSNIMISPKPQGGFMVTIVDFGAVANPQIQGGGSTMAGTYGYMAPEQLMGHPVPASDIYALAAVAVYLFSGVSPATMPVKDFRLIFEPDMQDKPIKLISVLRQMLEPKVAARLVNTMAITNYFKEFRQGNVDLQISSAARRVGCDAEYEKNLRKVRSVCEAGTMDLWQELSDIVPRAVPSDYDRIFMYHSLAASDSKMKKAFKEKGPLFVWALVSAGLLLFFQYIIFVFIYFPVTFLIYLIFTAAAFFFTWVLKQMHSLDSALSVHERSERLKGKSDIAIGTLYGDLLYSGRKSIAKIVEISYIPVRFENVQSLSSRSGVKKYYPGKPIIRIRYSFNPPDDFRSEDIIHECYVHSMPDEMLHVGDVIPILYIIQDQYFNDLVVSMPYPIPLDDIEDPAEVLDISQGFKFDCRMVIAQINQLPFTTVLADQCKRALITYLGAPNQTNFNDLSDEIIRLCRRVDPSALGMTDIEEIISLSEIILMEQNLSQFHADIISIMFRLAFPDEEYLVYKRAYYVILKYLSVKSAPGASIDNNIISKFMIMLSELRYKNWYNINWNQQIAEYLEAMYYNSTQKEVKSIIAASYFKIPYINSTNMRKLIAMDVR